jgi:hypothetical protein
MNRFFISDGLNVHTVYLIPKRELVSFFEMDVSKLIMLEVILDGIHPDYEI